MLDVLGKVRNGANFLVCQGMIESSGYCVTV
jgi:hypothetical protein